MPKVYILDITSQGETMPASHPHRIEYAIAKSTMGDVLAAQTAKGVCAVFIDDDHKVMMRDLAARFPNAKLVENKKALDKPLKKIIAFIAKPGKAIDIPLDMHGTVFQKQVWQALQRVPSGSTITYTELAKKAGKKNAVRAVASACAANPVSIIVPCHRIVRRDGGLGGYYWGLGRKKELLRREAQAS